MTTTERTYTLRFFVPGAAAPQGSKRHVGRGILVESSKQLGPWRERIALAAHNIVAESGLPLPFDCAIVATFEFVLPRPKSCRKTPPTPLHTKRPDLDKLIRAVSDALTNIVYRDDAQIVSYGTNTRKRTAEPFEPCGVHITIETTT
jgi:crossover junction endodeoxyribonuclease RusA